MDEQPRELTLETIFVPPGEDGEIKMEQARVSQHHECQLPVKYVAVRYERHDLFPRLHDVTTIFPSPRALGLAFEATPFFTMYLERSWYLSSIKSAFKRMEDKGRVEHIERCGKPQ